MYTARLTHTDFGLQYAAIYLDRSPVGSVCLLHNPGGDLDYHGDCLQNWTDEQMTEHISTQENPSVTALEIVLAVRKATR